MHYIHKIVHFIFKLSFWLNSHISLAFVGMCTIGREVSTIHIFRAILDNFRVCLCFVWLLFLQMHISWEHLHYSHKCWLNIVNRHWICFLTCCFSLKCFPISKFLLHIAHSVCILSFCKSIDLNIDSNTTICLFHKLEMELLHWALFHLFITSVRRADALNAISQSCTLWTLAGCKSFINLFNFQFRSTDMNGILWESLCFFRCYKSPLSAQSL